MIKLGITGTDTGVGKTFVACDIIKQLNQQGMRVAVMKPVETGIIDPEDPDSDAVLLKQAANSKYSTSTIRPFLFPQPIAPLAAASISGKPIRIDILDDAFSKLTADADAVIVEGAGGLLVPITETENFATLAKRWGLELVIVVANKLGAINHTLLTVNAARAYGIPIHSVVLNSIPGIPETPAAATNLATLKGLLKDVPVTLVSAITPLTPFTPAPPSSPISPTTY